MTAQVLYLENALTPQNRVIRDIAPCSIKSLAPDWQIPFIAFVDGQPVLRADWELVIEDGQSLAFLDVNCIPQGGGGGGGSNPLQTVLMIAVMVYAPQLAFATFGAGGTAAAFAATTYGAVMTAGVTMAGMALVSALIPPPQPTSPQTAQALAAASPTYNLQAQGNQARLEAAIPEHFGRLIAYPDFAAQPYQEYAGNEQYIYQLLCIGRGEYDIEAVRIEDTPIANFDDIDYEFVAPGGSLTLFPANVVSSVEVSGQTLAAAYTGPFIASASGTTANFLGLDFVAPRGLYYANNDGSLSAVSASVQVEARLVDDLGAPLGGWALLTSGTMYGAWSGWTKSDTTGTNTATQEWATRTVSGGGEYPDTFYYVTRTRTASAGQSFTAATTTPQRYSVRYPVAAGRYEVQVKRTDTEQTSTRYGHQIVWAGLRSYLPETRSFGDVTLLALRMRASNNLSMQSSRKINVICTRKLPIWNGATWSAPTTTRSIAWPIVYACKQIGLTDSQIDLATLLALDATWLARGDSFNARFDSFLSFWEAITKITGAGRTKPYMQGGVMRFMRDQAATVPVSLFSMRNIVKGSFSVDYLMPTADTADAVNVGYFDETTWATARVQAKLPDSTALKPVKVDTFGITGRAQAYHEGLYLAAVNRYRRRSIKFSTEMEGFIPSFGDLIAIQHDMPAWGQGGEITAWNAGTRTATLSEPPTWGAGTHYIGLRMRDGSVDGPYVVTAGATAFEVILATSPSVTPYTGGFEERTHYSFGWAETWRQRARVLSARPQGLYRVAIECINEDDNVHTADQGVTAPVAPSSQLAGYTNAPVVTGVTVTPMLYHPDKLVVSWKPAEWADNYVIEQSSDGVIWTQAGSTGSNTFTVNALYGSATLIRVAAVGLSKGPWSTTSTTQADATPPPLAPTAIATGALFSVNVAWSFGDGITGRSGTEVWWSATNDRTAAARLSVEPFPGQSYTHVGLTAGQGGYYWVRVMDAIGGASPWYPASATGGLAATAISDPSALLTQLNASLDVAQLTAGLSQRIELIDGNTTQPALPYPLVTIAALQDGLNQQVRLDLDSASSDLLASLATISQTLQEVHDAGIYVEPGTGTVKISGLEAANDHLTTVDVRLDAAEGSIALKASTTYVDGAIASAVLGTADLVLFAGMNARVTTAEANISSLTGSVNLKATNADLTTTNARMTTAEADIDALEGQIALKVSSADFDAVAGGLDARVGTAEITLSSLGNVSAITDLVIQGNTQARDQNADAETLLRDILNGENQRVQTQTDLAFARQELTAYADAGVSAEATARLLLEAETAGNLAVALSSYSTTSTTNAAIATAVDVVQARLDTGDYAAVKAESSATANRAGVLEAKSTLKLDVNGHVSGTESVNDGVVSSMVVLADKFLIAKPDGTGTPIPMMVLGTVDGVTALGVNGNLIVDGSLTARSLAASSITADKMTVGTITAASGVLADAVITSAKIASLQVTEFHIVDGSVTVSAFASSNGFTRYWSAGSFAAGSVDDTFSSVSFSTKVGDDITLEAFCYLTTDSLGGMSGVVNLRPHLQLDGVDVTTGVTASWNVYYGTSHVGILLKARVSGNGATRTATLKVAASWPGTNNGSTSQYRVSNCILSSFTRRR